MIVKDALWKEHGSQLFEIKVPRNYLDVREMKWEIKDKM
jgi:hypothetical protein